MGHDNTIPCSEYTDCELSLHETTKKIN